MKNVKNFDSFKKLYEDKATLGIQDEIEKILNKYYSGRRTIENSEHDYRDNFGSSGDFSTGDILNH